MAERLVAIYVETPYQLITSLNIAKNYLKADGCVLFLMEQYYMTDKKFQIKSTHPFIRGIYYIQDYVDVGAIMHHLLRLKGILKGYTSKDYPNMLCYYKTRPKKLPMFSALICNKYEEKMARQYLDVLHRDAEVFIIEDGTGDYVNKPTRIDSRFKRIYYWPELFITNFNENAAAAPKISLNDDALRNIFIDIFSLSDTEIRKLKNCKCIYFHQPRDRKNDVLSDYVLEEERKIINTLHHKFGDSFFIKLHPRDDTSIFKQYEKISADVPWEAMMFYLSDISHTLLVGNYSTTLFSPKCTFNEEPYVITTAHVLDHWRKETPCEIVDRIDCILDFLQDSYSDGKKVMIPKSMDEFDRLIDGIYN